MTKERMEQELQEAAKREERVKRDIIPNSVLRVRGIDPRLQMVLEGVLVFTDGRSVTAKVLADPGSESSLIRMGWAAEELMVDASKPKEFFMADDMSKLPGGKRVAPCKLKLAGYCKQTAAAHNAALPLRPYEARIGYDLILGHEDMWALGVGHNVGMETLELENGHDAMWLYDYEDRLKDMPTLEIEPITGDQVRIPQCFLDKGHAACPPRVAAQRERGLLREKKRAPPKAKVGKVSGVVLTPYEPTPPKWVSKSVHRQRQQHSDRFYKNTEWGIVPEMYDLAWRTAGWGEPDWDPYLRSPSLRKTVGFLPMGEDAHSHYWGTWKLLWICGPYDKMSTTVQQLTTDKVKALVVAPEWTNQPWWDTLNQIAVKAWVFPDSRSGLHLHQDGDGSRLPQREWRTVLFAVDTTGLDDPDRPEVPTLAGVHRISSREAVRWNRCCTLEIGWDEEVVAEVSGKIREEEKREEDKTEAVRGQAGYTSGRVQAGQESGRVHTVVFSDEGKLKTGPKVTDCKERLNREFSSDVLSGKLFLPADPHIPVRGGEHVGLAKIQDLANAVAKRQKGFRLVGQREAILKELVEDFLAQGIIEPCGDGPWLNNVFPVAKKSGKFRMVGDFRYLNTQTEPDNHPIPKIEEMIERYGGDQIFTIIDLKQGFHHVPLDRKSRMKTAFKVDGQTYRYRVMPMGIKQAPATFQRMMDWVLGDMPFATCYIDDILIG